MNLSDYLELHSITQAAFAKKMEVTQGLIHQFIYGKTVITAERAIEIERVTGGAVTRAELRPDLFGPDTAYPKQEERAA